MSPTVTASEAITTVASLVSTGQQRAAKRNISALLDAGSPRALEILGWCAHTLETHPHRIALEKLRHAWKRTRDEESRELIAACAPKADAGQYLPTEEPERPSRYGRHHYQAPRDSHTRIDPARRIPRRDQRGHRDDPADVTAYMDTRAGIDDNPEQDARPDGYALDYDRAAVPALRNTPCVFCWLERSNSDHPADRTDDGLCGDCRDAGRTGIPELPGGHTRAEAIEARCATITTRNGRAARAILKQEWRRTQQARDRATIAAWAQAHAAKLDDTSTAPNIAATPAVGACEDCTSRRQVRHGLCLDCRHLDT